MSKKRTSHKPNFRQDWIYEYLIENGNIGFNQMFRIHREKFSLSEQTFAKDWKIASSRYKEYINRASKAKDEARVKAEVDIALKELKSKHERLLEYQRLVDDCFTDLATGMTDDSTFFDGELVEGRRRMTIVEINQTRRTLKDLQTEISKIEGDYSSTKIDHTIEEVKPIFNLKD